MTPKQFIKAEYKRRTDLAIDEILGMVDEDSLYFDYWIEVKEEIEKM